MDMKFVKGRRERMVSVGWQDFVLEVLYKSGARYQFGGVPKDVCDKLLRVPFPDSLFQKIVRGKYVGKRIDTSPAAKQQPQIEYGNLPF
jgi:hypothetical protein